MRECWLIGFFVACGTGCSPSPARSFTVEVPTGQHVDSLRFVVRRVGGDLRTPLRVEQLLLRMGARSRGYATEGFADAYWALLPVEPEMPAPFPDTVRIGVVPPGYTDGGRFRRPIATRLVISVRTAEGRVILPFVVDDEGRVVEPDS